ncbi:hypothetical protein [Limnoglobus roseus]|uniref:Uncharacterized protein n=1 Tax=Limnoglobus roseus TaxID=2598579 RepID=A0A5C1ACX6_9BACT|nr:hypothetical protein [Limnoglobus roseus]QEL17151.1 hypothetical protein PX52LOC_04132 [Limnoglobus roseus]
MPVAGLFGLGRLAPFLGRAAPAARGAVGGGGVGRALGGLGNALDLLNLGNAVAQNLAPQINTQVSVTVTGTPGSDFQKLYRLALSVAFGCLRARKNAGLGLLPPASTMTAHFDPVNSFLGLRISYSCSALGNIIDDIAARVKGVPVTKVLPVFVGFPNEVTGDEFSQLSLIERTLLGPLPQLEGANQVLLTNKPTLPSPAPGGDRVGRGFLEGIVARSLLEPEHLIAHPEITEVNPNGTAPSAPGSYSPLAGSRIPTPRQNVGTPDWSRYWFNRGFPTNPGVL